MAARTEAQSKGEITAEAALAGILVLLADQREHRVKDDKDAAKNEVLLARAGIPAGDIAALLGKNTDAVRKTLQRAKGG